MSGNYKQNDAVQIFSLCARAPQLIGSEHHFLFSKDIKKIQFKYLTMNKHITTQRLAK
jgi:hypothetical protein